MQLDLSCLTKWHPCARQRDIMPAAWAEYEAERPRIPALRNQPDCSPRVVELLGREASNIATGEVLSYTRKTNDNGYAYHVAAIRVLERLKGSSWKPGDTRELLVWDETWSQCATTEPRATKYHPPPTAHSRFTFAFGDWPPNSYEPGIDLDLGCPMLPLNDSNRTLLRQGMRQDFSANDTDLPK
jgi:hypothetical protein